MLKILPPKIPNVKSTASPVHTHTHTYKTKEAFSHQYLQDLLDDDPAQWKSAKELHGSQDTTLFTLPNLPSFQNRIPRDSFTEFLFDNYT